MWTDSAPASLTTRGIALCGSPRRTTSRAPCSRRFASNARSVRYRNATRGAPAGFRRCWSSRNSATTGPSFAAACSAGWSRSRRSRRSHSTDVTPASVPVQLFREAGKRERMSDTGMYGDSVYEAGDAVEDAENLDPVENLTGDDPDEIMQTSYVPPDREPHNLRHAPTPFEEREGESLDERLSEEQPDITADDIDVADE